MFYAGRENDLRPPEYRAALCHRLDFLPTPPAWPVVCDCGERMTDDSAFIRHTLSCSRGKMTAGTGFSYQTRHDVIKWEALEAVPKAYGIACIDEPDTYGSGYEQKVDDDVDMDPDEELTTKRRPDVQYHTYPNLAIDLSVVYPGDHPGVRACSAANRKRKKHDAAVKRQQHVFAPFIIEVNGYMDPDAFEVINVLTRHVPAWLQPFFRHDMLRTLSVALQRQITCALNAARHKYRNQAYASAVMTGVAPTSGLE